MTYVTSIERIGRAEGLAAGRIEGLEAGRIEGLEAGRIEGKRLALRRFVERRFGRPSDALAQRLADADEATLDQMLDRVIEVPTADAL